MNGEARASPVATLLVEIGHRLVLAGENPYKARAYSRAAQKLLTLTLPLGEVIAAGRLREIPRGRGGARGHHRTAIRARGDTETRSTTRRCASGGPGDAPYPGPLAPEGPSDSQDTRDREPR